MTPKTRGAAPAKETAALKSNQRPQDGTPAGNGKPRFGTRQERAEDAARQIIYSWCECGRHAANDFPPDRFPNTTLRTIAEKLSSPTEGKAIGWPDALPLFSEEHLRAAFIECTEGMFPPTPDACKPLVDSLRAFYVEKRQREIAGAIRQAIDSGDEIGGHLAELAKIEAEADGKTDSRIVEGVLSFPTEIPAERVLLGTGWGRRGDILTLISTAGNGKSVAMAQAAMAWGIGLPYLGIRPARPLRVLLFSGEDDEVTIGQCREGLLEHSEAITGRQLSAADLQPLNSMLRTEFCREHVGPRFHTHLARLLREQPADLVIINPLLSYVGGEIVACASEFLRAGLMPILQQFDCAALLAHHTGKMAKDGWENTEDTYSAIGGGEMANIPRAILTLRPTAAEGLSVLKVSKRQTTGWKDAAGKFSTSYFVRRSDNPERPAWLPVDSDEAAELMAASKGGSASGKGNRKVTVEHVTDAVATGAVQQQALIESLRRTCQPCCAKTASKAILIAERSGAVSSFTEPNPNGGKCIKWLCLPEHREQWER
jgi:hypothetical protein